MAVIVEAMTDNRNRTASEVRHLFDKYAGNMGAAGCVSWSFDKKGVIVIDNSEEDYDEDTVMEDALEAGADDVLTEDEVFEVYTDPDAFADVCAALEGKYTFAEAEIEMVPQNYVKLTDPENIRKFEKMLELMEDNEDIQNVWHNREEE